jgi:cobaltochelatase CobN
MHLLATTSGVLDGGSEPVDLRQSPGDIVFLTAADSEITALAGAVDRLGKLPCSLRLANLLQLQHPYAVDLYIEKTLRHARLVVLRLLGGKSYWPYGLDQIVACAGANGQKLIVLPGDNKPDPELSAHSTVTPAEAQRLLAYLSAGGAENAAAALQYCFALLGQGAEPLPANPLPPAGMYRRVAGSGHAVIIFYRALMEASHLAPIDALVDRFAATGHAASAIYVSSLKDDESLLVLHDELQANRPNVIINLTSFSASAASAGEPLARYDCAVLQGVLCSTSLERWTESSAGLPARDLAMSVVLPELDGRIHGRVISFKSDSHWHAATECRIITHQPVPDRVGALAQLATNWMRLAKAERRERNIAIVLANYPVRDGRIANGVGYDSPASAIAIMQHLKTEGYDIAGLPTDGGDLVHRLAACRMRGGVQFSLLRYRTAFNQLPEPLRRKVIARWGEVEADPAVNAGAFNLPVLQFGRCAVGIQPSRGYNLDPEKSHHDPALVPPHAYIAFYLWMREAFSAHAIIHNGKHGNLEWLPGKSAGLSEVCFPDAILGPLPHIYPFIVNDPGEGTQAKRRASAVIIDHLTPPLARAETYGPLKDLEALIDEYYLAAGLDPRRAASLRKDILSLTKTERLDIDAGLTGDDDADLVRLDAYICELKEAQIRDGLHVLGSSPVGQQERELAVALARVPRRLGEGGDASVIRSLAADFCFCDFDPLSCEMATPWKGPKPTALAEVSTEHWRSNGDTVERLELFAQKLEPAGPASRPVMQQIRDQILPAIRSCGPLELAGLLAALDGRRVSPGPSGAPTRGRIDVLPTGRNFYSLDNRSLPTPTAWTLGQKSAATLLERHRQETGNWPTSLGLTAWGTSNMRTGGDDIAQLLALIGAKPVWDTASWRVTGFEILPLAALGRPRIDVTLRISGFFRDAFPVQIELLDKAIRTCGALDEDEADNPIAARFRREANQLTSSGMKENEALELAGQRIFGSKPGAYGAGLQALIDEGIWKTQADLAAAYVTWGSFAYGAKAMGIPSGEAFRRRLASIEAVVHNQDNREHDLLDSDDYYQFEGGMNVAVQAQSGTKPRVYHNDHSRPEKPVVRSLEEEIGRVMRSRVVNPKWIAGVKRHGYKGAFEIAATVDYMFAFAATTGAVKSHHFDMAYEAFVLDEETRNFMADTNPAALRELSQRLQEAIDRGLWTPRANSAYHALKELHS